MGKPKKASSKNRERDAPLPWRIYVVRRAPLRQAVVMLRGPRRTTATFLWDLDDDRFQIGQMLRNNWLKIDECDLSADGKWFGYYARTPHDNDPVSGSRYHVVSRPPYLSAVYLDPHASAHENNPSFSPAYPPIPEELRRDLCSNVHTTLHREGWSEASEESTARWHFGKPVNRRWHLVRCKHGYDPKREASRTVGGCYSHVLVRADGHRIPQPDWEWADTDNGQLIWAEKGQLHRAEHLDKNGPMQPKVLYDFRGLTFRRIQAPY